MDTEETVNMKLRLCELETKVLMYEQHIKMLESHIERYDTNLKLSIQTPSISSGRSAQQQVQQVFHSKLYETMQLNLDVLTRNNVQTLLENHSPAYASIVHLMEKALQGPHSQGQLLKLTTSSFCKYLNSDGQIEMDNVSLVFDKMCKMVYEKCKDVVTDLSKKMELLEEFNEAEHEKNTNRYNNIMLLQETRSKARILKEITPILK